MPMSQTAAGRYTADFKIQNYGSYLLKAVHKRDATIRGRVAVWKSLAAGLVIGSGGSAGREGPVVHLGGAVASSLSRLLALPHREAQRHHERRRVLLHHRHALEADLREL